MARREREGSIAHKGFGAYLRHQRQLARLTLRQLAELSSISNPYLSQIERGLHQPSVTVIRSIAEALNLSADVLLAQVAGVDGDGAPAIDTEAAIKADPRLTGSQRSALLSVYRSMVGQTEREAPGSSIPAEEPSSPAVVEEDVASRRRPNSRKAAAHAPAPVPVAPQDER